MQNSLDRRIWIGVIIGVVSCLFGGAWALCGIILGIAIVLYFVVDKDE